MNNTSRDIVLAFSGGLDTSFCVPYLKERGWNVHTVFADTVWMGDALLDRSAVLAASRAGGDASDAARRVA